MKVGSWVIKIFSRKMFDYTRKINTPMSITEQIIDQILSNLKPAHERKIGVEYETIVYDKNLKRIPANSENSMSSQSIIKELEEMQVNDTIKSWYTLEPGGQIEWASPPLLSLHEIDQYLERHKQRFNKIIEQENLEINPYSVEPIYLPGEIPLIDNEKYRLMDDRFAQAGELGRWMMRNTSSVQINLDYSSREEAEKMAFVADCLTPIATILFANSPFWKGKPVGETNLRYKIWHDTDKTRCCDLFDHNIRSEKNLIQKYAEFIQKVPAIFIDDGQKISSFPGTLGEWMEGLARDDMLSDQEIQIALHQIFTHVRFKNVIEIRGCDKPPVGFELAPVAFWVGILLSENALDEAFEIVKKWTNKERELLKTNAFTINLSQNAPKGKNIGDWIDKFVSLSEKGLGERSMFYKIDNELGFLLPYIEHIKRHGIPSIAEQNSTKNRGIPAQ